MPFKPGQSGNIKGRPRTAVTHAGAIAKAETRIAQALPQLIDNLLILANGVWLEETNIVTGMPQVYQEKPDRQANEYLINRILGKPTERAEHSGPDGNPIPVGFNQMLGRVYGDDGSDPTTEPSSE